MIVFPTPFLARGPVYRGPVSQLALAAYAQLGNSPITSKLSLALSPDGDRWFSHAVHGDLPAFVKQAGGPGAFDAQGLLRFGGKWFAFGTIYLASGTVAGLFVTEDGRHWSRVSTGFEATGPLASYRGFSAGAAGPAGIILAKPTGELVYSEDGASFGLRTGIVGYSNDFGPAVVMPKVASVAGGVVVIGAAAQTGGIRIKTAATPGGIFTDRGAPMGEKSVPVLEDGNIVLAISISSPGLGAQTSAYAMPDNLATWADAGLGSTVSADRAFFALERWYAGAGASWLTSTGASSVPGVGGWAGASTPWAGSTFHAGYEHEGRAFAHFGQGRLAVSDDGTDWELGTVPKFTAERYFAAAA